MREACHDVARACACFQVRKAARAVSQLYDAALAPIGIKVTQFTLLIAIESLGDQASLTRMARELVMDRTTLTRNLAPLRRAGLVQVAMDRRDRRARCVALEERGRELLRRALPLWQAVQADLIARLGPEQWQSLRVQLGDVVTASARS